MTVAEHKTGSKSHDMTMIKRQYSFESVVSKLFILIKEKIRLTAKIASLDIRLACHVRLSIKHKKGR